MIYSKSSFSFLDLTKFYGAKRPKDNIKIYAFHLHVNMTILEENSITFQRF